MRQPKHLIPAIATPLNCLFLLAIASVKAIQEKIGDLADKAQAIVDMADNRDLTDDEKKEVDAILGCGKPGEAGYIRGSIELLESDLARAKKLEARQAALREERTGVASHQRSDGPGDQDGPKGDRPRSSTLVIPAKSRFRHSQLRAYQGEFADERAFIAGQFLLATVGRNKSAADWCSKHDINTQYHAALSEDSNSSGGFLVPVEMEQAIIDLREQYGVFRRNARIVPMGSDTKTQPYRKTGLTAYFVGENDLITESEKTWGSTQLVAKKLAALSRFSNEINEDAIISIGDDLTSEMAYAFAVKEDNCGFNGDGTSTYGGIVGLSSSLAAGSIYTAASGNVTFDTLDMLDFENVVGNLPEYAGSQPKWYISKPGFAGSMLRLLDAAGGNTMGMLAMGAPREFLGYPVEISQVLPKVLTTLASTIMLYFGDLRQSVNFGNRRGIAIAISDQRYFEYDQMGIRGTERFDITVHSVGDATNPGAIIALKAPSS